MHEADTRRCGRSRGEVWIKVGWGGALRWVWSSYVCCAAAGPSSKAVGGVRVSGLAIPSQICPLSSRHPGMRRPVCGRGRHRRHHCRAVSHFVPLQLQRSGHRVGRQADGLTRRTSVGGPWSRISASLDKCRVAVSGKGGPRSSSSCLANRSRMEGLQTTSGYHSGHCFRIRVAWAFLTYFHLVAHCLVTPWPLGIEDGGERGGVEEGRRREGRSPHPAWREPGGVWMRSGIGHLAEHSGRTSVVHHDCELSPIVCSLSPSHLLLRFPSVATG